MNVGPAPWRQAHWDARAAGNFIFGGAGGGLLAFIALSAADGPALTALVLAALALIGAGLACVWFEIGRPWRALHVFLNPRTSWMTREAFVATLLFPLGLAVALGARGLVWPLAALALVFVWCQGRMVMAARGIPAWREPLVAPLFVVTGLVEGGGLFFAFDPWHRQGSLPLLVLFGTLVLARVLLWLAYRWRIAATADARALSVLDRAGRWLQVAGTLLPLLLVAGAAMTALDAGTIALVAGAAGLLATLAGAYVKLVLITRAGFNQGFALAHLPVRGQRRAA